MNSCQNGLSPFVAAAGRHCRDLRLRGRPLCDAGMGLRIDDIMCTSLANRYEQAAAQGNADGLFNLACMLRQGQGIPAGTLPTK